MAKRFTDTELWNQDWFLDIPKDYKLFYFYMKDACNHAGIFKPNFRVFSALNDCLIDGAEALKFFNSDKERILVLDNGRWLIKDFFLFQYGTKLNNKNKCHQSVFKSLEENNVKIDSLNNVEILKVTETQLKPILKTSKQSKPIKDNTKRIEQFEVFWGIYDKNVNKENALKKFLSLPNKDVEEIARTIKNYILANNVKKYRKAPLVYLNQKCWNDEIDLTNVSINQAIKTPEFNQGSENASFESLTRLFESDDLKPLINKYKTNKKSLKTRLEEFLYIESKNPNFTGQKAFEVYRYYVNWLKRNPPKIVIDLEAKRLREEKWDREHQQYN